MYFASHMSLVRLFISVSFIALSSCSILTEGDILTASDVHKLKLTSIDITGNLPKAIAEVISTSDNKVKLGWPDGSRIKFKSGVANGVTIDINYLPDGKLKSCMVYDSVSVLREAYSFFYFGEKLKYFNTVISKYINTAIATQYETKDTLQYDENGGLLKITRGSTDETRNGIFKISDNIAGIQAGSCDFRFFFSFQNQQYEACDPQLFSIYDISGNNKYGIQIYTLGNELLDEITVSENAQNDFYFHPVMILQSGYQLVYLYSPDWWSPSTSYHNDLLAFKLKMNYAR